MRDLRFPVATVLAMVADGMAVDEILDEHPDLEAEDIAGSLRYAALAVQDRWTAERGNQWWERHRPVKTKIVEALTPTPASKRG